MRLTSANNCLQLWKFLAWFHLNYFVFSFCVSMHWSVLTFMSCPMPVSVHIQNMSRVGDEQSVPTTLPSAAFKHLWCFSFWSENLLFGNAIEYYAIFYYCNQAEKTINLIYPWPDLVLVIYRHSDTWSHLETCHSQSLFSSIFYSIILTMYVDLFTGYICICDYLVKMLSKF